MFVHTFSLRFCSSHILVTGADIKSGAVFCRECNDFIYHPTLDETYVAALIAAEEKLTKFQGEPYNTPYKYRWLHNSYSFEGPA